MSELLIYLIILEKKEEIELQKKIMNILLELLVFISATNISIIQITGG